MEHGSHGDEQAAQESPDDATFPGILLHCQQRGQDRHGRQSFGTRGAGSEHNQVVGCYKKSCNQGTLFPDDIARQTIGEKDDCQPG